MSSFLRSIGLAIGLVFTVAVNAAASLNELDTPTIAREVPTKNGR